MRVRECQYCKCLVEEASWCDCAEAERDMRAFDHMVRASRSAPKLATPEPPEWKEPFDPNATMYPSDYVVSPHVFVRKSYDVSDCHYCGVSRFGPMACQPCPGGTVVAQAEPSPLDRALSDFTARRKAKRSGVAPSAPDDHPWARAGHTHASWSTDACPKCLLTGQEVKELGYYPKCDDYKREREERAKIARAMSTPLPHDPEIRTRLMPWKGKADE